MTDPNASPSSPYYDAYGRTVATKDSRNIFTMFEHDLLGRITKRWTGVTGWTLGVTPTVYETLTVTVYHTAPGPGSGEPAMVPFTHQKGANARVVTES